MGFKYIRATPFETYFWCWPNDLTVESLDKYQLEIKIVRPGYKSVVIPFDFKSEVDNPEITVKVKLDRIEE